jgi:exopolysaccharide biosynthesis polyprenyl glycosylphosphotransferase
VLIGSAMRDGDGRSGNQVTLTTGDHGTVAPTSALSPGPAPTAARAARQAPFRRWVLRAALGDAAAALLASLAAQLIRFGLEPQSASGVSDTVVGLCAALSWPLIMAISGSYELRPSMFAVEELRRVLRGGLLLTAGAGLTHIVFQLELSRGYFSVLFPAVVLLTAAWRSLLRTVMSRSDTERRNHHRAVAVGPAAEIAQLRDDLARRPKESRIEIVAYVADDLEADDEPPHQLAGLRRLPDRAAIQRIADHDITVDLIVRAGRPGTDETWALGQRAHDLGMAVAIAPHRHDPAASVTMSYVPLGSTPLLMVETPTLRPVSAITKTLIDRTIALTLLVVLSPLLLAIAVAIAVRDGRPVLFRQERVGRHGKPFTCLKFRTMVCDAEEQLPKLFDQNEAAGPLFKLHDDPRITRTGRFLRHHSLDELPQLVNVLRGDMSIVGPRPPLAHEVATYDIRTKRRLLVRPGITGLWQTQGRSDLPWDDGIYLDVMYVDHWSPLLDLVIMARTAKTILRPSGAY